MRYAGWNGGWQRMTLEEGRICLDGINLGQTADVFGCQFLHLVTSDGAGYRKANRRGPCFGVCEAGRGWQAFFPQPSEERKNNNK